MFLENKKPEKDYYHAGKPELIRVDTVRRIKNENVADNSIELKRLEISDDSGNDIIVSVEEAESIKEKLLSLSRQHNLPKQIEGLTIAIRELRDILQARLR